MPSLSLLLFTLPLLLPSTLSKPHPQKRSDLNIIPLSKIHKTRKATVKRAYGTETLINALSEDSLYMGTVGIGTPAQNFTLQFDTGSSDLWVYLEGVTTSHPTFDPSASSTFKNDSFAWSIEYGDGDETSGYVANDTVAVAGFTVAGQGFAIATTTTTELNSEPEDGLIGLGFQDLAADESYTFFENLLHSGQLANPYFSFFLERDTTLEEALSGEYTTDANGAGGELCVGCMDADKFNGTVEFYNVTSATRWAVQMAGISLNGQTVDESTNLRVDIDTGTSIITVPTTVFNGLSSAIGGEVVEVEGAQLIELSCSNLESTDFGLVFGSTTYTIATEDLIIGTDGNGNCLLAIEADDVTDDDGVTPLGIMGDVFLKNVYSVFQYSTTETNGHSIGFAPSNQGGAEKTDIITTGDTGSATQTASGSQSTGSSTGNNKTSGARRLEVMLGFFVIAAFALMVQA